MNLITSNRALSLLYSFLNHYQKQGKYTILLPSNICHDVFFLILHLKIPYVIVDIEAGDLCIKKEVVSGYVKNNSKTILLYNHTYGNPHIPYDFFVEIKGVSSDLMIIDDRCLCLPLMDITPKDQCIDLIIYSTGKAKQVDLGGGAFGFINDLHNIQLKQVAFNDKCYRDLKSLFYFNRDQLITNTMVLADCLISVKNEKRDMDDYIIMIKKEEASWREHKKKLRTIYESLIPAVIQLPSHFNSWRFNIKIKNKQLLLKHLFEKKLFASDHYPSIGSNLDSSDYRISDGLHQNILNLFIDKYYTDEMAVKTTDIINQYLLN